MSDFTRLQKRHVHTYRQAKVVNIKWHWNSSMAIAIGNAKHCKISLNCWYFFLASSWQLGAGKKTQNCIKLHWEVFINSSNCCHILSFNCRSLSHLTTHKVSILDYFYMFYYRRRNKFTLFQTVYCCPDWDDFQTNRLVCILRLP